MILAAVLTGLLTLSARAADLSGKWLGEFDTPVGHQKYVFSFQADSTNLTAKADAESDGEPRKVEFTEAKIASNTVTFVEMLKFQDNDIRIEYTGKVGTNDIQFSRKVGDFATEEFVAKRTEAAAPAVNVVGLWLGEFDTPVGHQKYVFSFQADGTNLTAKADAESDGTPRKVDFTEAELAGDAVTFVEMLKFQDNDIRIEYTGKVGANEIQFSRKVGDFATEEFVAKRTPVGTPPTSTNSPN